jgi:hypothetical protein
MTSISKKKFQSEFVPELEVVGQTVLEALSEILGKYPDSKLIAKPKSYVEKNFITYIPFVLESEWADAPYPEDFAGFEGKEYEVLGQKFKLEIEDSFLKSRSKLNFSFVARTL